MSSDDIDDFLHHIKSKNIPDTLGSPEENYKGMYQYILEIDPIYDTPDLFPGHDGDLMGLSDPPGGSEYTELYNKINQELNFEKHIILISLYEYNPFTIMIEMNNDKKGGKKKSTKKRTPTKRRRRPTKRRRHTKRRRSTKRRR